MPHEINSLATEYTATAMQPEVKFWRAILLDGVRSMVLHLDTAAAAWFRLGRQVPASFDLCCEVLDIDPARTREGVLRIMALPEVSALARMVAELADVSRRLGMARRRQWDDPEWAAAIPYLTAERDRQSRDLNRARKALEVRFGFKSQRCGGHPGNNGRRGWRKHLTEQRQSATQ